MVEAGHVYSVSAPRAAWRRGDNDLALEFAYAESPKDRMGAADGRTLAACFDWLEIVPVLPLAPLGSK
jgi:hypothetical protein